MKAVSRGQALEISARVSTQVNWDELDGESLQDEVIQLGAEEFGARFTAFLRNGARLIVGALKLVLDRSKKFDPAKFIGKGWTIWEGPADGDGLTGDEEQDTRSTSLIEVDLTKVRLETMLKPGETVVKGEEKLRRLKEAGHIRLDAGVLQLLWENKRLIPESWKKKVNGNIQFIYFDGTVLRGPDGLRHVLYLYWDGGKWDWRCRWLGLAWDASRPSAVLASI